MATTAFADPRDSMDKRAKISAFLFQARPVRLGLPSHMVAPWACSTQKELGMQAVTGLGVDTGFVDIRGIRLPFLGDCWEIADEAEADVVEMVRPSLGYSIELCSGADQDTLRVVSPLADARGCRRIQEGGHRDQATHALRTGRKAAVNILRQHEADFFHDQASRQPPNEHSVAA